jgi:hypothetical protein
MIRIEHFRAHGHPGLATCVLQHPECIRTKTPISVRRGSRDERACTKNGTTVVGDDPRGSEDLLFALDRDGSCDDRV